MEAGELVWILHLEETVAWSSRDLLRRILSFVAVLEEIVLRDEEVRGNSQYFRLQSISLAAT